MSQTTSIALSARLPQPQGTNITAPQWRVLCEAIFPGAQTAGAIQLALDYCAARKLDPFKRPVHIVPMWSKLLKKNVETVWPGINELQVTASRTGQWAGMDDPRWGPMREKTFTVEYDNGDSKSVTVEFPEWCAVTVYRMIGGERHAFSEPVYWLEAYGRTGGSTMPNEMWQKRTRGQLHKCAKAASLRAAFPEEVGNDYASDEMEGKDIEAGGVTIQGTAVNMAEPPLQETDDEVKYPTLHGIPDGRDWLNNLNLVLIRVNDTLAIDEIEGLPVVVESVAKAPPAVKAQIKAMFVGARGRVSQPTPEQFLALLKVDLDAAGADADAVDAILARPEVHHAQDKFRNGDKRALDFMIAAAIERTKAEETSAPNDEAAG